MKNTLWFFLILLASCKPDEKISPNTDRIKAGIIGSNMVYYDFEPDIVQDTTTLGYNFEKSYDLNSNGIPEITLRSQKTDASGRIFFAALLKPLDSQPPKISFNVVKIFYRLKYSEGVLSRLDYNEGIDPKKGVWTTLEPNTNGGSYFVNWLTLAGEDANGHDTLAADPANNWRNIKDGYVGLRMLQGQDTLYGWIRVSVEGSTKITLHDCAIEKN
jgi:hypothetical protein